VVPATLVQGSLLCWLLMSAAAAATAGGTEAQLLSALERGAGVGEWLELRQKAAQNVDVITKDACGTCWS
jgi:hypothetical protein